MTESFVVTIGEGKEAFTVTYNDYGNACECALTYRERGFAAKVEIVFI